MTFILLTALGVGGSTVFGAILGLLLKRIPYLFHNALLSFAAGVMLTACFTGLIIPSIQLGGTHGMWVTAIGIMTGAALLSFADRFMPHLHSLAGMDTEKHSRNARLDATLLFVFAIAIHNLPEGIAAGVAAGQGSVGNSLTVTIGIMLQNIPEGMIVIFPLLSASVNAPRAFMISAATGLMGLIGAFIGYGAVNLITPLLPFALAFAAGAMLYVIGDEMIPETHKHGYEHMATYALLIGIIVMLIMWAYFK